MALVKKLRKAVHFSNLIISNNKERFFFMFGLSVTLVLFDLL